MNGEPDPVMSNAAESIRVEGIGKQYRLGEIGMRTLRESLAESFRRLLGRGTPLHHAKVRQSASDRLRRTRAEGEPARERGPGEDSVRTAVQQNRIWAIEDVSFTVRRGEVVGVIGRNGAGKSTLLKVLTRITTPTEGRAFLYGRVASLLEVGTGFHPELTGRDNVYLNGAVLGMTRSEIDAKFDNIVEFSGVGHFIDTPVKRYSSGMKVRLGFAVAAHLDPEILLIDEVLAVGDASFQKRCLGKMKDIASTGRTILFVSHNMRAITRLCPRAILLEEGRLTFDGPSHEAVSRYLGGVLLGTADRQWPDPARAPGNELARLRRARVTSEDGAAAEAVDIRKPVILEMVYDVLRPGYVLQPNFHLYNDDNVCVFVTADRDPAWWRKSRPRGRFTSRARIPGNFLAEGRFSVSVALSTPDPVVIHFVEREGLVFQVIDSQEGDSVRGDYTGQMPGVVRPDLQWTTEFEPGT